MRLSCENNVFYEKVYPNAALVTEQITKCCICAVIFIDFSSIQLLWGAIKIDQAVRIIPENVIPFSVNCTEQMSNEVIKRAVWFV